MEKLRKNIDFLTDTENDQVIEDIKALGSPDEIKIANDMSQVIVGAKNKIQRETIFTKYPELLKNVQTDLTAHFLELDKNIRLQNPFKDQEYEYQQWHQKEAPKFLQDIDQLFAYHKKQNSFTALNLSFYEKKLEKEQKILQKQPERLLAFKESILEKWHGQLVDKKLKFQLRLIDKERKIFLEELYTKIEQLKKIMKPLGAFIGEPGRLWDLSSGIWQQVNFDLLQQYETFLQNEESIQRLAELLGRFHEAEIEEEKEIYEKTVFTTEWKADYAVKSELVGVIESDNLDTVLPSEIALLADPATELLFYKKFAEKKLLTFELQGKSLQTREDNIKEERTKKKEDNKGPIIICLDTSGSMHGIPEQIAKILSFALLKIALRDQRACYLISFSTQIQTIELTEIQSSLPKLIEFLGMSFRGGTDASPALTEAMKMLETNKYKKADIVVVSDFIMGQVSPDVLSGIQNAQEKETKFHSLVISNNPNKKVLENFDTNWYYDQNSRGSLREVAKLKNQI